MIERVKFYAGITVGSLCLPEPSAPMNRCCARLKPSILAPRGLCWLRPGDSVADGQAPPRGVAD